MIRRLAAVLSHDFVAVAWASVSIGLALNVLHGVIEKRTTQLTELDEQVAARRQELADLEAPLSPAPVGAYPAREDLDPLVAGED